MASLQQQIDKRYVSLPCCHDKRSTTSGVASHFKLLMSLLLSRHARHLPNKGPPLWEWKY